MSEKNILAFFKSPELAQRAAKTLQELGIEEIQIDRYQSYPGDGINRFMNPLTGQTESLAGLTLGLEETGPDSRVLLDASVSASGMSDGGNDVVSGHDILLTIVVDESLHHQALKVLKDSGALV
ncbi:MAG: hypothetical protein QHH10_06410 [Peptococcaceae bacterium]|jgi:hypothetical protein|nr:hypothetical protein [Peptococcaceae bacterium]MDH7524930.1 hypothetical protein [Peptococcaceae bacterium]